MTEILKIIVHALADAARNYVKESPTPLDDLLIPIITDVEKWVVEKLLSNPAVTAGIEQALVSKNVNLSSKA